LRRTPGAEETLTTYLLCETFGIGPLEVERAPAGLVRRLFACRKFVQWVRKSS